jgi:PHD/YefM family antitoxin component YafN of YafNO toxin-antitoxin module
MGTAAKTKTKAAKKRREYLVDERGRRTAVVLSIREYEKLLEAADDLADMRAADEARAEPGERLPLEAVEARLPARGKLR